MQEDLARLALSSISLNRTLGAGMDKVRFEAALIEGHKGVIVVLVPSDHARNYAVSRHHNGHRLHGVRCEHPHK
jgi:hypothetical protein